MKIQEKNGIVRVSVFNTGKNIPEKISNENGTIIWNRPSELIFKNEVKRFVISYS